MPVTGRLNNGIKDKKTTIMKIRVPNLKYLKDIRTILSERERRNSLGILSMMVIAVLLETLGVGLVIPALALFTEKDFAGKHPVAKPLIDFFGNPDQTSLVFGGLGLLFSIYLIKALFLLFMTWRQNHFIYAIGERLSQQLLKIYLHQPYTFHLERNSAQLIRNVTTEVEVLATNVLTPILQLSVETLTLLCIFSLLLIVEPLGTLNILLVLGLTSISFVMLTRQNVAKWGNDRQHHEGLRMQHLQQGLGGIKDVKILGKEDYFLSRYGYHNTSSTKVRRKNTTIQQVPRLWLELLSVTGLIVLVLTMMMQGKDMDSIVPNLGFFAVATFRMMPSVNRILNALQSLQYCLPVVDIISRDFSLPFHEEPQEKTGAIRFKSSLHLENITYAYPQANRQTIEDITLTIQKGESVGFIGPSGSGKSTLIDLLLGLLAPNHGTISIDGNDIRTNMRGWQNIIGYVPQSIYLTDDDLEHNIAFGLSDEQIDRDKVLYAVEAANLAAFVKGLPDGLATFVGERGIRLSGGQKQRIGIARALYHNPEVLVLDEATSALDMESETAVMEAVTALHGSKTIIIVAHRLTTVEHCDRIYRLENGKITSQGSPAEMLTRHNRTLQSS
ncbi:ATPase [Pelodictyon luteolum DSM 273]|uniref:ATPase n=2 Tax=Pelodictyon luteolum TaxID=1100 RepID=Q3B339_CHLL3|nr:ATPase [Pelodictyon luteolum DSM 273]